MKLNDILNNLKSSGYITICDPNNNIQKLSDIADTEGEINDILNKLKDAGYITIADPNSNIEKLGHVASVTSTFTINPTPADSTVTINDETRTSISEVIGAIIEWSVEKTGYIPQEGLYTMDVDDYTLDVNLVVGQHTFTINPTPNDATVIINGETRTSLMASEGEEISWSVSKTGYTTQTGTYTMGSVDYTENVVLEAALDYLTFNILEDGQILWKSSDDSSGAKKIIEYKKNNGNWTSITSSTSGAAISVNSGDNIQFRGNNTTYSSSSGTGSRFVVSCRFNISGNIMSLLYPNDFESRTIISDSNTFRSLFNGNTGLIDASELKLPATTLADFCYASMLQGCSSLTSAPILPATILAKSCYAAMFYDCTSLTTAPALPATTLAETCYYNMFAECLSLTTAPALPATTLAKRCYGEMFYDCTSLTTSPVLPATTLADFCYDSMFSRCTSLTSAPVLPATTLANSCYAFMFLGCTGLTTAPVLPASTLADGCYVEMFTGCTSLTTSPVLPATTLVDECYGRMFSRCSSLNYVECLAEIAPDPGTGKSDTSAYCSEWLVGVSQTGTFVKNPNTVWATNDPDASGSGSGSTVNWGVPAGWTVQDAQSVA